MTYAFRAMGDYKTYGYAGDPGFLSSLWKGFKKVAKFLPGPVGAIARVAGAVGVGVAGVKLLGPPPGYPSVAPPSFPGAGFVPPGSGAIGPGRPGFPLPTYLGPGLTGGPTRGSVAMVDGCCPQGYHPEKSGKPYCVRNRRMNVGNARALRRGMRRVQGFEKLARRTIQFTRRVKMKKRRSS